MQDKILLLDFMNFAHRANISFGAKHSRCGLEYSECSHPIIYDHCSCGGVWDTIEQRCEKQSDYTVVYNFFRNLRVTVEQFKPDKIFIVLEGHPKFRHELYPEYKSNRIVKTASQQEVKDNFFKNTDIILELLTYLPITIAKADDYECDDVIATLVNNLQTQDITIVSNDTDYIQLLQKGYPNCKIYSPTKKEYMSAPKHPYIVLKALTGDKSDNIKSLMGPKTAEKTLADLDKLQKFMSIEENRANFNINKQLIEFANVNLDDIVLVDGIKDFETLKSKFNELKFNSLTEDKYWEKFCNTFECARF